MSALATIYKGYETFFYEFHHFLQQHKEGIYKYTKSLPVLFAHKHRFFEEETIAVPVFSAYTQLLHSDAEFLDQLVGDTNTFDVRPPHVSSRAYGLYRTTRALKIVLGVLTLGIALLVLR